jgi:hypothetical protein
MVDGQWSVSTVSEVLEVILRLSQVVSKQDKFDMRKGQRVTDAYLT